MKVYVNREPVVGPWGGGNRVVTQLCHRLREGGHSVVYGLCEDIDIIFCFDPRPNLRGEWFEHFYEYKVATGAKIVQRVGDLGTHNKPRLTEMVKESMNISDFVIFPSEWAKERINFNKLNFAVVHNAPLEIFHKYKRKKFVGHKINIITHHWSPNPKKGYELYHIFDKMIASVMGHRYSFSYIGAKPQGVTFDFEPYDYTPPTGDNDFLASKLAEADIYLTASLEEAGANHVLEAMAAGLPIVYHKDGGSIEDYCSDYGESFENIQDMVKAIEKVAAEYDFYKDKVLEYNDDITRVIDEYEEIINNVQSQY